MNIEFPNLARRVVMVTGAVGNLGQVVASRFHASGARLALIDRAADRLPATFPEIVRTDVHLLLTGVDVGSEASMKQAAERTLARFGQIDVLVNTVGAFRGGKPTHEADIADWDMLFEANVRTTLNACRAVIPAMVRQKSGRIINIGSQAALRGEANLAAYCAAKSAVVRLTESLAAELGPHGVNVNCLLPGTLDTPQNRAAMPEADRREWVTLDVLVGVIAFLASDAARGIQGAAIPLTGAAG